MPLLQNGGGGGGGAGAVGSVGTSGHVGGNGGAGVATSIRFICNLWQAAVAASTCKEPLYLQAAQAAQAVVVLVLEMQGSSKWDCQY
jgi:hypothetical protein